MIDRETGRTIGPIGRSGFIGSPIARSTVSFDGRKYEPGTIIVNTTERRLYYVLNETSALKYGIGVGRDGFRWAGMQRCQASANGRTGYRPSRCSSASPTCRDT